MEPSSLALPPDLSLFTQYTPGVLEDPLFLELAGYPLTSELPIDPFSELLANPLPVELLVDPAIPELFDRNSFSLPLPNIPAQVLPSIPSSEDQTPSTGSTEPYPSNSSEQHFEGSSLSSGDESSELSLKIQKKRKEPSDQEKALKNTERKERNRIFSKASRERTKERLNKAIKERQMFLQLGRELGDLSESFRQKFLEFDFKPLQITPQLDEEEQVTYYHEQIPRVIEGIVTTAVDYHNDVEERTAHLQDRIVQLEKEVEQLKKPKKVRFNLSVPSTLN